ncbi:hypothetical protein ACHAW6_006194 [Cyclotella cf. meneghiniana]
MATRYLTTSKAPPGCITFVILMVIALNLGTASSFSTVRGNARDATPRFPKKISSRCSSSSHDNLDTHNHLFPRHAMIPNVERASFGIYSAFRFMKTIRKSIARAIAIFSFAFIALGFNTRPAVARTKSNDTTATKVQVSGSSSSKKFLKLIVTAGAVAAGAATANKVLGLNHDSDNATSIDLSVQDVVADGTDTQIKIIEELSKPALVKKTYATKPNAPLVRDLDAKIERLKEQEKLALVHAAEKERAEQAAKDKAANQKQIIAEKIAKSAEEEANRISALEKERNERAMAEEERTRVAAINNDRKERIAEKESKVALSMLHEDRSHTLVQSSEPSHVDESRLLVENESTKKQQMTQEEALVLKEKYAAMGLEDRAFNVLVDLGMVELHPDPSLLEWRDSDDDNIDSINIFL